MRCYLWSPRDSTFHEYTSYWRRKELPNVWTFSAAWRQCSLCSNGDGLIFIEMCVLSVLKVRTEVQSNLDCFATASCSQALIPVRLWGPRGTICSEVTSIIGGLKLGLRCVSFRRIPSRASVDRISTAWVTYSASGWHRDTSRGTVRWHSDDWHKDRRLCTPV